MEIRIRISLGNEAMQSPSDALELAKNALEDIDSQAEYLQLSKSNPMLTKKLRDLNGNTVGSITMTL